MIRSLFLVSRTVSQGVTARMNVIRPLTLLRRNAPHLGLRSLIWIWMAESLFSVGTITGIGLLFTMITHLILWLNTSDPILALFPVVTSFNNLVDPMVEQVRTALSPVPSKTSLGGLSWFAIKEIWYALIVNSIYQYSTQLDSACASIIADASSPIIAYIGIPIGIFYKFAIQPIQEVVFWLLWGSWHNVTWEALVEHHTWWQGLKQLKTGIWTLRGDIWYFISACSEAPMGSESSKYAISETLVSAFERTDEVTGENPWNLEPESSNSANGSIGDENEGSSSSSSTARYSDYFVEVLPPMDVESGPHAIPCDSTECGDKNCGEWSLPNKPASGKRSLLWRYGTLLTMYSTPLIVIGCYTAARIGTHLILG